MAYCTNQDVQNVADCLIEADNTKISNGIAWGDSVIESKLGKVYTIPFSPVPAIIRSISKDLAAYHAMFSVHTAGGEDIPMKAAEALKARAYELLEELQGGDSLASVPGPDPAVNPLPPSSILSNSTRPGVLRNFDLVNIPRTCDPPFSRVRGGREW